MKQNPYDDPAFFARYSEMARSTGGLAEAGEWPAFRELLPELRELRVLDLGCGYGWHCRFARERGARSVLGVDLSERMLERARQLTSDPAIEYRRCAIEELDLPSGSFDLVVSSLALHYVRDLAGVLEAAHRWLAPGGTIAVSVEHPIFTARAQQEWHLGPNGERLHWPVDDYQLEGVRHTSWMAGDVVKYHRTVSGCVNALIDAGFRILQLLEPSPSRELLARHPDWKDEARRPMFLLLSARREGRRDQLRRRMESGAAPPG